jgi:dsDNA-specific endonuclease/ATPase MutS2
MSLRDWWRRRAEARRARPSAPADPTGVPDADEPDVDPFNPFPEPVRLEITDVFDLHTVAPRDVGRAVEAYLLEAHRLGFRCVRLIHGKGRGVQRATVRAILARTPFVLDWADAPPEAGGLGATIARFRPER